MLTGLTHTLCPSVAFGLDLAASPVLNLVEFEITCGIVSKKP